MLTSAVSCAVPVRHITGANRPSSPRARESAPTRAMRARGGPSVMDRSGVSHHASAQSNPQQRRRRSPRRKLSASYQRDTRIGFVRTRSVSCVGVCTRTSHCVTPPRRSLADPVSRSDALRSPVELRGGRGVAAARGASARVASARAAPRRAASHYARARPAPLPPRR